MEDKWLSSKHLLTTTSEKIEFTKEFYEYFNLTANEITVNEDKDYSSDEYSLLILGENIVTINELDEGEFNEFVTIFHVKNNKTGEIIEIYEKEGKELYISPELKEAMKLNKNKKINEIKFNMLPDDGRLFLVQIENAELTKPLYDIMGILNTKDKREKLGVHDINSLAQTMLDLLIESKINVMAVHSEVLLSPLIRSATDILEKPDFTKWSGLDDIQMLTISGALEKHPSVLIGLSFQFLSRQLISPLTFKKNGTSFLDAFFREQP